MTYARRTFLTFDDGPDPVVTDRILSTLDINGIRATFFVIGRAAARHPEIVQRVHSAGHGVGNHSFHHWHMAALSESEMESEILQTDEIIRTFTGEAKLFRPPYDSYSSGVHAVVKRLGYRTVLWNVDTDDWQPIRQPDKWVAPSLERVSAREWNSIVVCHDIHATTADHLQTFIDGVKRMPNMRFGEPSDLADLATASREDGADVP